MLELDTLSADIAQAPIGSRKLRRKRRIDLSIFDDWSPWCEDPAILPRREWLYGRHYLAGMVSLTVAPAGIGKSTLAIAEAIAMATGRSLLGVPVAKPLNVYYWNGEEPFVEIKRRVFAACQRLGVDPLQLGNRLRVASGLDASMIITDGDGSDIHIDKDEMRKLRTYFEAWSLDVMIVDPFKATHRCNENDNTQIDMVVRAWARLARGFNIAIEIIHHPRKHAGETGIGDARGASSLIAAARSVRTLNPMTEAEAARASIKGRAAAFFRADLGKSNYAAPGAATWFELAAVAMPNGDKVATVAPWRTPSALDGIEPAHRARVRSILADGDYRSDVRSEQWVGKLIADVIGIDAAKETARLKAIIKIWLADGTLCEIKRKAENRHVRTYVKPGKAHGDGQRELFAA